MSHCPGCLCTPASEVGELVRELIMQYGSRRLAGRAYSERYGLYIGEKSSSGSQLMHRILHGQETVSEVTLDRLKTLAAS